MNRTSDLLPAPRPALGGSQPLVSVVTPFYNTARYLGECIESVLAQTYGNFEFILSDNSSTDGSLEIAQSYAQRDSRIRVVPHTEFIDQDANYNRALQYISPDSRYTKIAQADDCLFPNCLEEMVALAAREPTVAIVSCCFLTGNSIAGHGLPFDRKVFTGREACRTRLLTGGTYFGSPTCLLYRSDMVRARPVFYGANETNADTVACFEILEDADFGRVPQILCALRRGNPSVSLKLRRLGATSFFNYALVERFGPIYLTQDELKQRRRQLRSGYLRFLGRALVMNPQREFWAFHRNAFSTLGQSLPWGAVVLRAGDFLLQKLLNPRQTVELALETWRRPKDPPERDS